MDFKKKYGSTTLLSIVNFESKYGYLLPEDYKEFLVVQNGGIPLKKVFLINKEEQYDSIDVFFGLDMEKPFLNLDYLVETYQDKFPKSIFPIGEDSGCNYICLNVDKSADYGKIYFYDHEVENEDENCTLNWSNLYLIANSFTEFLEKLH